MEMTTEEKLDKVIRLCDSWDTFDLGWQLFENDYELSNICKKMFNENISYTKNQFIEWLKSYKAKM